MTTTHCLSAAMSVPAYTVLQTLATCRLVLLPAVQVQLANLQAAGNLHSCAVSPAVQPDGQRCCSAACILPFSNHASQPSKHRCTLVYI
jgi:hypothetical protein